FVLVVFMFLSSCTLSDLLSFPTRRSSDLGLYRTAWVDKGRAWVAFGHGVNLEIVESADGGQHWQRTALAAPGVARHAGRCAASEDRKSTRLNSSHVKISYAVFCLKKKTTN